MNKKTKNILIMCAILLAINAIVFLLFGFTIIGDSIKSFCIRPTFTSSVDLKDAGLSEFSALEKCFRLRHLDVRGNDFSREDYLSLRAALPECDIAWDAPIGGEVIDSSLAEISLGALTAEDAALLDSFYNLERVNVTDNAVYQPLSDYCKARGDVSFVYNISLCGTSYDSDTTELTLSGATAEDVNKLPFFTNLASVDVTDGCTAYDELLAVREAMPDCDILWKVDMFGVEVLSSATEMIINEHPVASFDECVKLIGYLPNLTYAEMCDCKLSNRQMESLIEKFPNIDFVWKIYFGRWSARTDIVAFSTLNHGASEFGEDDFAPLFKYCTDLEVLDLGHNSIRDISAVTNLQKLEVLIVMDNFISDMTPVAQLPNLVYAELYTNPWRDASFIADMKAIRDLNIANCFIADYSFLNDLPATLENIWISDNFFDVPSDEMREIRKKYPNCAIEDFWPATWYENRWYNERWAGVKTACDYWQYVTAYDYWDNITFDAPADVVIEEHEQRYKPPQDETSAETEDTDSDGEN